MQFFYAQLPSPDWIQAEGALIKRLLIHCWAPWNGHDVQMHNHLVSIQQQLVRAEVQLRLLDIDNEAFWPLLKEHRVLNVPALLLFSDGKLAKSSIGAAPPEEILKLLGDINDTPLLKSEWVSGVSGHRFRVRKVPERGQGRTALFAVRRSEPLTPCRDE